MRPQRLRLVYRPISRRRFLKCLGWSGLAAAMAACRPQPDATVPATAAHAPSDTPGATAIPPTPTSYVTPSATSAATHAASPAATHTRTPRPATATPTQAPTQEPQPTSTPRATATDRPTATATDTPSPPPGTLVATGQAASYDLATLRGELGRMLGSLGGIGRWVQPGARVGIKANLTGGTWYEVPGQPPAIEYFVTHPAVVRVIGEMALAAGAGRLVIMDGLGDPPSFQRWGYTDIAAALGAELIDLCVAAPYADFQRFPVGHGARIYDEFWLHPVLGELDVFISVAKLKCHYTAGVTLSMKNLIGMAPISRYRRNPDDTNRSALHDTADFDTRIPRIILDLLQARPVHLAVIDGIMTAEGGAGPWDPWLAPVRPGVLIAGGNPVATDAVSAAVMGFDPDAPTGTSPFLHGDNHLTLAREAGFGTNHLSEIGVAGPAIEAIRYPFRATP